MTVNMSEFTDKASEDILMSELEETLKDDNEGIKLREYIDRIGTNKADIKKKLAKGCTPDMKVVLEKLKTAWERSDFVIRTMHERLSSS